MKFAVALLLSCSVLMVATLAQETKECINPALAAKQIADHLTKETPNLQLGPDYSVHELTTMAVWKELGLQVFQVRGNARRHETYALIGQKTVPLGRAFGGDGVTSLAVADLDGDGKKELLYSFNWGSGIHRSQIGILESWRKTPREQIAMPANYSFANYELRTKENKVEVFAGTDLVGELRFSPKQKGYVVQLHDNLPAKLKGQFR